MNIAVLQERMKGMFPDLLGIQYLEASPQRVTAELFVRDELCTLPGRMHGGAIMAFADTLGAVGTILNLPSGAGTTTIESKTNFIGSGIAGEKVIGETLPIHLGRTCLPAIWEEPILKYPRPFNSGAPTSVTMRAASGPIRPSTA